jgi:two-component system sensor histidine kinase KdpD
MRNITEDAAWLLNMVENILSVTKIQDDNRTLKKSSEPLEEIMSDSVHRVKRRIPDKHSDNIA